MPAEVTTSAPPPPIDAPMPSTVERGPNLCANCGHRLGGPFCSYCGQHVKDLHRSVWRFLVDFLDNAFCWDNKLFLTLRPLLTRPGLVTLDYLSGRRVRYVHPFRLFLFTSAVCLTIIQYFSDPLNADFNGVGSRKHRHRAEVKLTAGEASPSPSPAAANATDVPDAKDNEEAGDEKPGADLVAEIKRDDAEKARRAASGEGHSAAAAPKDIGDQLGNAIETKVKKRILADGGIQGLQKDFTEGVQRRVSWVALALLPIFAMMLRALYWRRDSYYFAHFVFSLHYHTALLLFGAAYVLSRAVLPTSHKVVHDLLDCSLLLPGVYLFLALRRMYGETKKRVLAKVFVLGLMHLLVLVIGLAAVGALAAWRALG